MEGINKSQVVSFGSWKSPITSDLIVSQTVGLGSVISERNLIYWLESRPTEKGRTVLVKLDIDGTTTDVTPELFSVKTRVHEYGGGSYLIADDIVYFSNKSDNRVYRQVVGKNPEVLTSESSRRYADFILDEARKRLICVCEDHSIPEQEPVNSIIAIALETGEITTLVEGNDFYTSPRLSPDGQQLAFISWDHPSMPWDSSYLWLMNLSSGAKKLVAGGTRESVCEPKWSREGKLYFSSDCNNWWNLYRRNDNGNTECLHQMSAEFAYPHWVFGLSTYSFIGEDNIVCAYSQNGCWHLGIIETASKKFRPIETPYTNIASVQTTSEGEVLFIGGCPNQPTGVIKLDIETGNWVILKQATDLNIDPDYFSLPEAIAFPTENGLTAYGWYYPPQNPDYSPPKDELPPLIVKSHGGPTAAASVNLNLKIQYWTSRGFGYVDVNYGGSIGYGREYRQRLDNNWGIVDVDDCINAAKYLVQQGKADQNRLVISGSSAGGYTTLAALTFRDTFKAGASYYGISDLETIAQDTHKFESRYFERLVGKYPEAREIYQQRSPINFTEKLSCPVIFFQGLEDKVVPPNQAEKMFEAIKNKGLPVAYVVFEDEGHSFRQGANIKKAIESEYYFYVQLFGFKPADNLETIEIMNN
ncbi:MAG: prolyl oligopeptidase family serine peptidase [Xenococcaceae cyanobacterium MO_167.B27]|nr:prolyl oligopeptidase family serine peptidase [Xenococcaceae cyanobacterium MO_167.B27]